MVDSDNTTVHVVISISHALHLFSIEGVFSTKGKMDDFLSIARSKNPGLEFVTGEKQVDFSRYNSKGVVALR